MKSERSEQRALIVMGMHRSGTSAFARTINLLGADMGDSFIPPGPDNPQGYWEHVAVYDGHERILNGLGRVWHSLFPFPENWWESEQVLPYRERILVATEKDFSESRLWGLKDPRMCRLMPVWHSIFSEMGCDPCFIYVIRNPLDVAASLKKRNGFSTDKCMLLWLLHTVESEKETRRYPRVFVTFDELLEDWNSTMYRIAETLGVKWPRTQSQTAEEISAFLNPDLRHHRQSSRIEDRDSPFSERVQQVYGALQEAARGDETCIREVCSAVNEGLKEDCSDLSPEILADEMRALSRRLIETDGWAYKSEERARELQALVRPLRARANRLENTLQSVLQSSSWKLTAPLRRAYRVFHADAEEPQQPYP